jgi:hypothetical protein
MEVRHSLYITYEHKGYLGTFLEEGYSIWFDGIPRGWTPLDTIDETLQKYMVDDVDIYIHYEGEPTYIQIWPK